MKEFIKGMMKFIDESASVYHVVDISAKILENNLYQELNLKNLWDIKLGGKYFLKKGNSSIIAFEIPRNLKIEKGFKIFASHTDSPGFKLKANPILLSNGIVRLNTEVYGGPILNTWFDRPLSLAGRVFLKSDSIFEPIEKIVKIERPLLTIPNLAIHQNREVNNGVKIDRQNDSLAIIDLVNENFEKENYLLKLLAKELEVLEEDILDFDLYLYSLEKSSLIGNEENMLSAPKIDNLASVYAGLIGLIESDVSEKINLFIGFDNEEIGSTTKQGADSEYLSNVLERIVYSLGYTRKNFLRLLSTSFIISADGAHAAHPAHLGKSDPSNLGKINEGVSIKLSANQRYTTDAYTSSVIKQLIKGTDIKIQYFINNSNEIGGSTIGPISSSHLAIDSIDLGVPMLAMHSVRELCGIYDIYYLKELAKEFYNKN